MVHTEFMGMIIIISILNFTLLPVSFRHETGS